MAGGDGSSSVCSNPDSFLGVGNAECLGNNLYTATFLVTFIIVLSIVLDIVVLYIRKMIKCPQMRIIVNRIFEEIMVLGFISTVLFALGTSLGIFDLDSNLTSAERQHFKEFFHYIIFLSMIYYIFIELLLLLMGALIPKWLWHTRRRMLVEQNPQQQSRIDLPELPSTAENAVESYHIAYKRLREKFENQPWTYGCSIRWQFSLWKSFEMLAFHLCRDRSRPIYSNPEEMQRIFSLSYKQSLDINYEAYNKLCIRNMLANITSLHWSGFLNLIGVVLLTSAFPEENEYVFIGIGVVLLALSVVIMIKTSSILRGIVEDRLKILTQREIDNVALLRKSKNLKRSSSGSSYSSSGVERKKTFKILAISVRAIIRMQLSALDHQALHHHDDRFWFRSPWFLLRLFQFATFGQAFYLVWFSLVQSLTIFEEDHGWMKLVITLLIPVISLLLILPITIPSLVLALSLTGFFVEQGRPRTFRKKKKLTIQHEHREHMRRVRRSYLRNSRTSESWVDGSDTTPRSRCNSRRRQSFSRTPRCSKNNGGRSSPNSEVLLRQYDLPSPSGFDSNCENSSYSDDNGISPTKANALDVFTPNAGDYVEYQDTKMASDFAPDYAGLNGEYCTGLGTYVTESTKKAGRATKTTALAGGDDSENIQSYTAVDDGTNDISVDIPSPTAFKRKI